MYTYDIDAADMFEDRADQFAKFGIPADEIERVRAAITDMWADAPGGWVYEWSKLASEHADRGDHYLASLIYGCAKFPCLTDPPRVRAMQRQLEQFQLAAKDFPVSFERRIIAVPFRDGTVEVPVHLYSTDGDYADRPVLIASGGVDTWKMDIHPWWVALHQDAGVTTLAFDHPGTGETVDPARRARRRGDPRNRRLCPHTRQRQGRVTSAHPSAEISPRCPGWPGSWTPRSISAVRSSTSFEPENVQKAALRHARHPGQRHALGPLAHPRGAQRRPRTAESTGPACPAT